jgi:hypothetical protein
MLLTALAFHLHYTGILILLGEAVVLLGYYLVSRKPVPYRPWRAAFDWQIAVMLCLPAIGHVIEVAQRRGMWDSATAVQTWSTLVTLFPLYPALALGLLACGLAAVRWYRGAARIEPRAEWMAIAVIAVWLFAPLLSAFAALATARLDLASPYLRRYLIALAIGPPLLTALLLTRIRRPVWQWLVAAGVLGFAVYDSNIIPQLRYDGRAVGDRKEDWRGAIAELNRSLQDEPLPVLMSAGLIEETFVYHHTDYSAETSIPDRVRLFEYLKFPLYSSYRLDARGLETKSVAEWESELVAQLIESKEELEWQRAANAWLIVRSDSFDPYNRGIEYVRTRSPPRPASFGTVMLGKARAPRAVLTSTQSQSSNLQPQSPPVP